MNNGLVVRNIIFINRAPFEKLDLKFIDGINVLSSENGRGKTTIMSYIVDALYEIAKRTYSKSFEGHDTAFYRISSGAEMLDSTKISLVYIRFSYQGENIDYLDARGAITKESYEKMPLPLNPIPISVIASNRLPGDVYKFCHFFNNSAKHESIFSNHLATYFPAYRYELPAYLNEIYQPKAKSFNIVKRFNGVLPNPIEVVEGIDRIAPWLLDVVLDWKVYEDKKAYKLPGGGQEIIDKTLEAILWHNVCEVLQWALLAKRESVIIRFGIGRRNNSNSRVSVVGELPEAGKQLLSPSISHLSSGEKGLLCVFGEILRQADNIHQNIQVDEIDGLVLVDEIDKHLHIRLQKEALPRLFDSFFNLQYIVSSHSPFLNMGLADYGRIPCQIIDLDAGGVSCAPRNNQLYQQVYEMMLNDKVNFAKQIADLQKELDEIVTTKVLVVTEGKTDIIHINKAKEKLGITLDYDTIVPEKQPDGESDLLDMLKQIAKTPNEHKIIGIFDCDTKTTKGFVQPYVSLGNNVYAFKIQPPQKRIDNGQSEISIEYLYSDDEVKTMLPNGTRLFFGTEFSAQTNRSLENPDLCLTRSNFGGSDKIIENTGKQAVYDAQGNNYLAKKSDFAQAIADETIEISEASWENFRHIFDMIETINNL